MTLPLDFNVTGRTFSPILFTSYIRQSMALNKLLDNGFLNFLKFYLKEASNS